MSRAERRESCRPRVIEALGIENMSAALDLLELVELAWHDGTVALTDPSPIPTEMTVQDEVTDSTL